MQNLYGDWTIREAAPYSKSGATIHQCEIYSEIPSGFDWIRVHLTAVRYHEQFQNWPFFYEWYLSIDTHLSCGAINLAVHLGGILLAAEMFEWFVVIDNDSCIKNEPTEFKNKEDLKVHVRRVLKKYNEYRDQIEPLGLLDREGFLLLPQTFK